MNLETSPASIGTFRPVANATAFRFPRRYGSNDSFRVTLRPLLDPWDPGEPNGYLVQGDHTSQEPSHSGAVFQWTVSAVAHLQPNALLAFLLTPETVVSAEFAVVAASLPTDRVLVILEHGRVGRGRALLQAAMAAATDLGVSIAVTGNRVASTDGFDGLVVSPATAASGMKSQGDLTVVATDIVTGEDLDWARQIGARYVERPELVGPMQMAPVVMPVEMSDRPETDLPVLATVD